MEVTTSTTATILAEKKDRNSSGLAAVIEPAAVVRRVAIDEYLAATQCLAEAFATDDVSRYFVDTPDMASAPAAFKWKLHFNLMSYIVAAHCYNGIVTTIGPGYGAVALWMPPSKNMDDIFTLLRSGLWRLYYQLSREGRRRFFSEFFPLLHSTKTSVLGARDDEAWYLVYIGTKPSARGKGYAKALIKNVTDMADFEGKPCYLESSAQMNIPIYERMGFELKREIALERGEKKVMLGCMVREPVVVEQHGGAKEFVKAP